MPTKDELRAAIDDALAQLDRARRSADKARGPYQKPLIENIETATEILEGVDDK
jgi:hypothetical protein